MASLFEAGNLWQMALVFGAILASFAIRKVLSVAIFHNKKANPPAILKRAFDTVTPVFRPLLSLILISLSQSIFSSYFGDDIGIIRLGYEVVVLWAVLRLILLATDSAGVVWISGIVGVTVIGLNYTENLRPFVEFLNRFSFKIGTYEFSIVSLVKAVIALGILMWVAGVSMKIIRFVLSRFTKLRTSNRELAIKGSQIAIYFALFMVALDIMGIDLTALAVFGGAVGVGLGFGLQKITSNFISGLILLVEKAIEVGDMVEMDGGQFGKVRHIGARYTMIETQDTKEVLVPNEEFITTKVTNWTHTNQTGRMDVIVGVSYETEDLEQLSEWILETVAEHPRVLKNPGPRCLLHEFGPSSVDFRIQFWLDDVSYRYWVVKSDVMMALWKMFKEKGIGIPFPQRDLHLKTIDRSVINQFDIPVASKGE